jgi:hypothetical protein
MRTLLFRHHFEQRALAERQPPTIIPSRAGRQPDTSERTVPSRLTGYALLRPGMPLRPFMHREKRAAIIS